MSSISAGTSAGTALVQTGDTSGALVIKTGGSGTTAATFNADQTTTFAGAVSAPSFSGTSSTATNLAGGSAGTIPYQSAAGTTAMLSAGTSGYLLQSNGAAAPSWVAPTAPAGSVTAVASGSLTAGAPIVINSNGTVSAISGSYGSTLNFGGNVSFTGAPFVDTTAIVYDSANQCVVVAYPNSSGYPCAIVGQVSSTGVLTWGSPTVIVSSGCNNVNAIYEPNAGKVIVVAYYTVTNSSAGWVGTVSGTTISFGSPGYFNFSLGQTVYNSLAYDSVNQKIVVAYRAASSSSYGYAVVGTVSGTSISFDSRVQFNSVVTIYTAATYDVASGKIVIAYRNNDSGQVQSIVGTVSGTSISFGSVTTIDSVSGNYVVATYDSNAQKTVVMYVNPGNNFAYAAVGTVSGTSISFGTPTAITFNATSYLNATYHVAAQKVALTYKDSSDYGQIKLGTVSGTTISFGSTNTYSTGVSQFTSITYDSTNQYLPVAYALGAGSQTGTGNVGMFSITTNLTSSNFLGFSSATYSNGQTATINTVGSADTSQTGLTAGTKYYASALGGITTTAGSYNAYAGLAVSATKIVVKG